MTYLFGKRKNPGTRIVFAHPEIDENLVKSALGQFDVMTEIEYKIINPQKKDDKDISLEEAKELVEKALDSKEVDHVVVSKKLRNSLNEKFWLDSRVFQQQDSIDKELFTPQLYHLANGKRSSGYR